MNKKNKSLSFVLFIVVLLQIAIPGIHGADPVHAQDAYLPTLDPNPALINENFDSTPPGDALPTGWIKLASTNTEAYYQKIVQNAESGNSVELYSNMTSHTVGVYKYFDNQSGSVTFEVYHKLGNANTGTSQLYIINPAGVPAIKVWIDSANFYAFNNIGQTKVASHQNGKWYSIKIVANIETNKFDLYIDNALVAAQFGFSTASTELNRISLQTINNSKIVHESYWDQVRVAKSQTPPIVKNASPADGSTNVDVNTSGIQIEFNKAMDSTTINSSNIWVTKGVLDESVPFAVYQTGTSSYTLNLPVPLDYLTQYKVSLSENITDTEGLAIKAAKYVFTTVDNPLNVPSVVQFTRPADKEAFSLSDNITMRVAASDNEGIRRVDFYKGADYLGSDYDPPYEHTWNHSSIGSFTVTASVVDNQGKITTSKPATFTVNNFVAKIPVFLDHTGNPIEVLAPSAQIKAITSIENYTGAPKDAVLILALYSQDGTMKEMVNVAKTVAVNTSETYEATLTLPEDIEGGYVKAFLWNSMDEQVQLCEPVAIPING